MQSDDELFLASYVAILPFKDAVGAHENLLSLWKLLCKENQADGEKLVPLAQELEAALNQFIVKAEGVQLPASCEMLLKKATFFQAPTQTTLVTSKNQNLTIYSHPCFGKRVAPASVLANASTTAIAESTNNELPPLSSLMDFIQSFHQPEIASPNQNGSTGSKKGHSEVME